ncbi:MAG: type IX secretion system outer membrane channel protein PorV [Sphingobacteriales bacterium]|nr:MAG: type IX secretion system outer membrane channel protein PorV [Sphingobacteriales bacterium]
MKKIIRPLILFSGILLASLSAEAQSSNVALDQYRVITTTVPFLGITPDSRSGGMGDVGVAISPDANTIHWNPAKLAFMQSDMGLSLTYTPWLATIVDDISLSYLSGYKKINDRSGFGASLRYFSLGDITFTNDQGTFIKTHRPYEMAVDAAYALKLSKLFSVGIAGRFIYSDLASQLTLQSGARTKPGITFAGDISGYYTKPIKIKDKAATLSFGGNISNMGGKITYTSVSDRSFIPINMRLGTALGLKINEFNDINFAFDLNKLLVPTQPIYQTVNGKPVYNQAGQKVIAKGKDPNVPVISGMIQSFYDSPGGFKEEMQEINPAIGVEYWYAKQFAGRMGYFHENKNKGNRQYLTFGVGVRYNVLGLDIAYLVPTNTAKSVSRSPLENTLRFTLSFNVDPKKGSSNNVTP